VTWRVEDTHSIAVTGGHGYGFNIVDEHSRPVVAFVYATEDDAKAAAVNAHSLVENAILVRGHPGRWVSSKR
jgi:hypothetical protein